MELLTNKWVALVAVAVVLAFRSCAAVEEYWDGRWRAECVSHGGEIRNSILAKAECRRPGR